MVKDWDAVDVRIALSYPDVYDIGMSNLGLGILYDLLNQHERYAAERVYAPWPDMEAVMRETDLSCGTMLGRSAPRSENTGS